MKTFVCHDVNMLLFLLILVLQLCFSSGFHPFISPIPKSKIYFHLPNENEVGSNGVEKSNIRCLQPYRSHIPHRNQYLRSFKLFSTNDCIQLHKKSGCTIRYLEEKDLVPLVLMATHEFSPQPMTPDFVLAFMIYWGFRLRLLISESFEDHKVFVAEDINGDLAACCEVSFQPTNGQSAPAIPVLKPLKALFGFPCPLKPYIANLLVSPAYRRKGLARCMVSVCEAKAVEWGEDTIYLHCDLEYLPAVELYYGIGYERIMDEPYWVGLVSGLRLRWMKKILKSDEQFQQTINTKKEESKKSLNQYFR